MAASTVLNQPLNDVKNKKHHPFQARCLENRYTFMLVILIPISVHAPFISSFPLASILSLFVLSFSPQSLTDKF